MTSIVSADELNIRCSRPTWSPEQWEDADNVLAEVEGELSGVLNAPISPTTPRTETAAVIDTGLVLLRHPAFEVHAIGSLTMPTPPELPVGYLLDNGYLWAPQPGYFLPHGYAPTRESPLIHTGYAEAAISVNYTPGWGDITPLRNLILKRAYGRFLNRHDDTMTTKGLNGEPPPMLAEDITAQDIAAVSKYRWRVIHR